MSQRKHLILSESKLEKKMREFRTKEIVKSDDDDAFKQCIYQRSYPATRERYLTDHWIFMRNHLAKHNLSVRVNFEKRIMGIGVRRETKDIMLILRSRYLLKLLTFNIPFQYAVRILRNNVHVAFIKGGSMFKNQDTYYKLRHRLLEPDIRTLTYIELFTNCNVLLDQKTIILLGVYKGVKRASHIVWDTIAGNGHPIDRLKKLMVQYVQRKKRPNINMEDWNDFLSKFPPVKKQAINIVCPTDMLIRTL